MKGAQFIEVLGEHHIAKSLAGIEGALKGSPTLGGDIEVAVERRSERKDRLARAQAEQEARYNALLTKLAKARAAAPADADDQADRLD